MPVLGSPKNLQYMDLPIRKGLIAATTQVLVVGGGPAGFGAAMGAARRGAKVILAERYGFLGGNATAALVMPLMSFHTQRRRQAEPAFRLFPSDHGPGEPVIAGVLDEFLQKLVRAGGAVNPSSDTGYVVPFDPEIFKWVCLEMIDQAGVEFLLHAFASSVLIKDNILQGVIFETKSGPLVIHADIVIDCTGDGDIAARAGAPYEIGRPHDGLVQPMTLMFRMVDFQEEIFRNYVKTHPEEWRGVYGLWDLIRRASEAGELNLPREDVLFFGTPHRKEVSVNCTRVTKVLGVNVWDLTYAEWESRRQMQQIAAFFKKYVPGFEEAYVAQSGVQTGVRETRRIIGEYQLTADDIFEARSFDDAIARSSYPVDIHNPAGKGTLLRRLPHGKSYDIPLRCLIPKEIEHLLAGGRCISGTHEALSSYRVMPVAMATGQAAGVCGALAAQTHCPPRQVPYQRVQEELVRQHANLIVNT